MMFKRILTFVIVVLAFVVVVYGLFSRFSLSRPVPESTYQLALVGVDSNADWVPVLRKIEGFTMVLVPAGCFDMGSSDLQLAGAQASCDAYYGIYGCTVDFSNEQPSHSVCISQPFWIDQTEVTNRQFGGDSRIDLGFPAKDPDWPRETVSWEMAAEFCSQRGGRLPSEAEWEYAARGPDALVYPFGNEFNLADVTLRKISPPIVGQHPDGVSWVGAHDMSGGVAEWVADWYGPYIPSPAVDPVGPGQGQLRIARGGSWFAHAAFQVRTALRETFAPDFASSNNGFRCVIAFEDN